MVKVTLINPASRRFYLAQWDDPITCKTKTRSTKTTDRREAERFAGKLEEELNSGEYAPPTKTTWEEFQTRFKNEVSSTKSPGTAEKTRSTMSVITELLDPMYLEALADSNNVSKLAAKMRTEPIKPQKTKKPRKASGPVKYRSAATVDGHLRELRKMLIWAAKMKLIRARPHIEFPEYDPTMKGRPITTEEFERIISKVPSVIPGQFVAGWVHYLEGLWLSGLRRKEAMRLHWTDETKLCVDLTNRRPMMRIQANSDKGRVFRLLPITPDFAEFLLRTPVEARRGFVFNPLTYPPGPRRTGWHRPTVSHVGKVVVEVSRCAHVFSIDGKPAACHDFRRAFGLRWAPRLSESVLQELMRHEDIKTTKKFYLGTMAEMAAEAVWHATGNTFGNTSPILEVHRELQRVTTPENQAFSK